jgi:hypothetical protein
MRIALYFLIYYFTCTAKPAHVVTSIKQTLVLKGHPFLVLSLEYFIWIESLIKRHLCLVLSQNISYELNLFYKITCLIRPLFLCPKGDLLMQVWLYYRPNILVLCIKSDSDYHNRSCIKLTCFVFNNHWPAASHWQTLSQNVVYCISE